MTERNHLYFWVLGLLVAGLAVAQLLDITLMAWLIDHLFSRKLSASFTETLAASQTGFASCVSTILVLEWASRRAHRLNDFLLAGRELPLLLVLSGVAMLGSALVQAFIFQNLPHITDATSHVFQAKIMAEGKLTAAIPPCFEAFFQHNVIIGKSGLWHTKYFPGQAMWLTPGFWLGANWLMMPLGWGLSTYFFGRLACRWWSTDFGLTATMLFGFSPLGLLISASFMSHGTFLMFALAGFWYWTQTIEQRAPWRGLVAGLLLGLAAITRPQDTLPAAVAVAITFMLVTAGIRREMIRSLPWILVGVIPPLLILLGWNHALYGSWLTSGYHFGESPSLTPIIQDGFGFSSTHTPTRALWFAGLTLFRFDSAITGWPITLPFVALGVLDRRRWKHTMVCLSVLGSTIGLYLFFPYLGFELEARYYAPALPAALLLALQGLSMMAVWLGDGVQRRIVVLLAGLTVYAVVYYWPAYIFPKYAKGYEQVSPSIHQQASVIAKDTNSKVLVLIESDEEHDFVYSAGFVFNDPELRGPIIYARYREDLIDCLRSAFPERSIYLRNLDGRFNLKTAVEQTE